MINTFKDFKLSNQLTTAIKRLGIKTPTEIQEGSILHIMKGEDVIGESATGSGKTLAFGCGVIDRTVPGKGVQSLILTPTRELAEQVKDYLHNLSYGKRLRILAVYGGVSITPQIHELEKTDVVIATPGRLLDHLQRGTIDLSKVKILVMDEADRMFDMGFIDDVERIIKECPKDRQTMFFSATISKNIRDLAERYMNNYVRVSAKNMVDPSRLKQAYYNISKNMKLSLLIHLLKSEPSGLVMVFCNTRKNVDFVSKNLKLNKIKAIAIHGGLSQNKRTKTISSFNDAKVNVLVCTDVAARGLHINNVSHIYNYDIPKDPIDYVHRIGRTARAGEYGKVINLLCDYDYENFSKIMNRYSSFSIKEIKRPELKKVVVKRTEQRGFKGARRSSENVRGAGRGRSREGFGGSKRSHSRGFERSANPRGSGRRQMSRRERRARDKNRW